MRTHEPDPVVAQELAALDAALRGEEVAPEHAHLAVLADDVRAERPRIDPGFAALLEERVAGGFAKEEEQAQGRLRAWRPAAALVAAAALAAAVVLPVALSGDEEQTTALTETPPGAAEEGAGGSAGGAQSQLAQPEAGRGADELAPQVQSPGRAVERITGLTLAVPDAEVQEAANGAIGVADRFEGFVETSTVEVGEGRAVADLTLRVPTDRTNDALAALSRLGDVRERTQQTTDLTEGLDSTRERLDDARATREGLRSALEDAQTAEEVTDLRERLEEARDRVRRLGGELAELEDRTSLATIDVAIEGAGGPPAGEDGGAWTPGDALGDALDVLRVAAGVAIVAVAAAIPAAIVVGLAVLGVVTTRRRLRERALDRAQAGPAAV
jgi:hypothetical protein